MNRLPIVMEYLWLVLSAICLALGISAAFKSGFTNNYMLFVLAAVAFLMFMFRRYRRKNNEPNQIS